MRFSHAKLCPLPIVLALQAAFCSPLWAADITIDAGTTNNTAQQILSAGASDTSTITVNGTLSVGDDGASLTVNANSKGTDNIVNNGTIEATSGTKNGRAILSKDNADILNIINNAGANILAAGDGDAIKIGKKVKQLTINNQGTIWQKGTAVTAGQGLDLDDVKLGGTIINGSETNRAALIEADGADAIAGGDNIKIINYGTIITKGVVNTKCRDIVKDACDDSDATSPADGIDVDKHTGMVVENHGTISGSRHGITADIEVTVTNDVDGQIIGRNGSGVGVDGTASVVNYGLISGRYAGAGNAYDHTQGGTIPGISVSINDGDGDGVDIDGIGKIENHGRIEGLGAGGFDADGNPNGGDGIAMGGGEINNFAGASIWGQSSGILIDDGANGTSTEAMTPGRGTKDTNGGAVIVRNDGEITGGKGVAIGLVGKFDDTVINGSTGVITGGADTVRADQQASTTPAAAIQMGAGNDVLENAGRIEGKNGKAIDMGDDNDTLRLHAGSTIIGTIDGGTGVNLLETDGTQNVKAGQLSNFQNFTVKAGNTTFDYALGTVGNVQIDAGGALRVNGAFGTTGDLTVNGTLQAAAGDTSRTINVGGNYTQGANGVLETRIGGNGGNDKIVVAQTATLTDGATIRPLLNGYVTDGTTYTIVDAATLNTIAGNLKVDSTSNFLTYSLEKDGNDLKLVAHRSQSLLSLVPQNNAGIASSLQTLLNSGSAAGIKLLNALESLPNGEAVKKAASQLAPETNASAQSASITAQGSVFSAFGNRIDTARNGGGSVAMNQTGLAGGDAAGRRFWLQGLASIATQKERKAANGYDLDAQGLAIGFETDLNTRDTVGLSVGYTQAGVDGRGAGGGDANDVKSTHFGGYFSRTESNYTLDASLVLSANRYSAQRLVSIPGFTETLTGSYSGYQVGTRVEYGIPFKMSETWSARGLLGARLAYLDNGSYAESGGISAQRLDSTSAHSIQSVLGMEFVNKRSSSSATTLRARYLHEFANTPSVNATFVNGGPAFSLDGVEPGREALELGIGYRNVSPQGTVISIGYDMEIRDKYLGHQLSARAMWNF